MRPKNRWNNIVQWIFKKYAIKMQTHFTWLKDRGDKRRLL